VTSPFGRLVIIANPSSGRGRSEAKLREIESMLRDWGLDYRMVRTAGPGHAAEAAAEALRAGDRFLVAAGGDGTVHEVVNGMLAGGRPVAADAVLGVLATGSGCDFVKSFGIPGDAVRAARRLTGDAVRTIDVGKVTFADGGATTVRYFANIAEAGLGGSVVARASRLSGVFAATRYFFGFWLTLPRFRPATVRLDADGQAFEWVAQNVVVANCRFYGGGMQISPNSRPDDGRLDVLVIVALALEVTVTARRPAESGRGRGDLLPAHRPVEADVPARRQHVIGGQAEAVLGQDSRRSRGQEDRQRPDQVRSEPAEDLPLPEGFMHQPDFILLQVPEAAVDHPGGPPGGSRSEVILLHEGDREPARCRVEGYSGTGDPTADDQHVKPVLGHPGQIGRASPGGKQPHDADRRRPDGRVTSRPRPPPWASSGGNGVPHGSFRGKKISRTDPG
jgi:YegS/Rv2252/BmrU family lipid kinase